MITGSHNSFSYLPPRHWYMYPFLWLARCQRRPVKQQWSMGARVFDVRVRYDSHGRLVLSHGMMSFSGGAHFLHNTMRWLEKHGKTERVSVRVIYENTSISNIFRSGISARANLRKEVLFMHLCEKLEKTYTHIHFFGGERKSDWRKIYMFAGGDIVLTDYYGSVSGNKIYAACPWLHYITHKNRLKALSAQDNDDILLRDFI